MFTFPKKLRQRLAVLLGILLVISQLCPVTTGTVFGQEGEPSDSVILDDELEEADEDPASADSATGDTSEDPGETPGVFQNGYMNAKGPVHRKMDRPFLFYPKRAVPLSSSASLYATFTKR